jgi:hypothetical protein
MPVVSGMAPTANLTPNIGGGVRDSPFPLTVGGGYPLGAAGGLGGSQ